MWNGIGLALCCIQIAVAVLKSTGENFYAGGVYGMTPRAHRIYAMLSGVFAILFLLAFPLPRIPAIPLLAIYTLIFIFYFTSFARGFSDEE